MATPPTDAEMAAKCRTALAEIYDTGQSVSHDGRTLTMADVEKLQKQLEYWERRVAGKKRGARNRVVYVKPVV